MTQLGSEILSSPDSWDIPSRNQKSRHKKHHQQQQQPQRTRTPLRTATAPSSDFEHARSIATAITAVSVSAPLPMTLPARLLVCSIGNPAPYANTLHSAGHMVVSTLRSTISNPIFSRSRAHGNGQVSAGETYTLWQSPSTMNVSGTAVAAAWRQFLREVPADTEAKLVVVHDELELALGQVRVRSGDQSAKGHNGLKSCKEQLGSGGAGSAGTRWWRIGVGIGRPISRDPRDVSDFVLRKVSGVEKMKIEGAVLKVEEELRRLAGG